MSGQNSTTTNPRRQFQMTRICLPLPARDHSLVFGDSGCPQEGVL